MLAPAPFVPDLAAFRRLARQGDLIPVVRELVADTLTPVGAYLRLRRKGTPGFLLESAEGGERWGRYSVLGVNPVATLRFGTTGALRRAGGEVQSLAGAPLEILRAELARSTPVLPPELPRFAGGLFGYLSYDAVRWFERIPDRHASASSTTPEAEPFPDAFFLRMEDAVVFDNARQRALVVAWADLRRTRPVRAAYEDALRRAEAMVRTLSRPAPAERTTLARIPPAEPTPGGREPFLRGVRRALEYIRAGDVFQVVLSQPFEVRAAVPPALLYRALRAVNPSPYMFLLDLGGPAVVGASPELLVRVERRAQGGRSRREVVVRPIAGTRRRGHTEEEDRARERELRADPKERAEHVMLVDLGRNDVGRVSEPGTVRVEDLMVVERYSHVMHLVSQVRGRLQRGVDGLDALAAAFPAGTVSGAPKIRAMEIIDELEPARRGPYAGAVGALAFDGDLDFALTIRSARVLPRKVILQAGAGIVADSDPRLEWEEVQAKAAGVVRALELLGGGQ